MAKSVLDNVLDGALNYLKNNGNEYYVCGTQPTSYAEASSTYKKAGSTMTATFYTGPADAAGGGRKVTMGTRSGISVTGDGNAQHIAICKSASSLLLYVTTCTQQAVTSGNTVTLGTWNITIGDPT